MHTCPETALLNKLTNINTGTFRTSFKRQLVREIKYLRKGLNEFATIGPMFVRFQIEIVFNDKTRELFNGPPIFRRLKSVEEGLIEWCNMLNRVLQTQIQKTPIAIFSGFTSILSVHVLCGTGDFRVQLIKPDNTIIYKTFTKAPIGSPVVLQDYKTFLANIDPDVVALKWAC